MSAATEKIVCDFFQSFSARDLDAAMRLWGKDAVYHNIPVDPIRGIDAIRAIFAAMLEAMVSAEFELVAIASAGPLVFTERVDRFGFANGGSVALPVAGVHEVRAGKIQAFRDYFDLKSFEGPSGMKLA